jgi:hypothetical protein
VLAPHLPWRAAPGQIPGLAAAQGFNPRGGVLRLALLAILPLVGGAAARALTRPAFPAGLGGAAPPASRPSRRPGRARPPILVPAVVAHALVAWIVLVTGPAAGLGWGPWTLFAALAAASLGLAVLLGGGSAESGAPYLGAAVATLPLAFFERPPDRWSLAAAGAAYGLPILARAAARVVPGIPRLCRALAVAILLPGSVTALGAAACMRTPRAADVFEDGHALLPASEYFRGERPYRDIVPGHGLISDGGLAAAQLKIFGDDYRGVYRGEKAAGVLFWPAFYALGVAATGSPAAGFAGMLLSFLFFPQYFYFRAVLSLWTLALAVYAARSKRRSAWIACGAALPLGLCIAVEYAAYAAAAVSAALWVARGRRSDHLRRVLFGALVSSAAVAATLGVIGVGRAFLQATFVFLPALLPAYAMGFPKLAVPANAAALKAIAFDDTALLYGFVVLSVVLLGAFLPRAPRVGPRARGALPVLAWMVAAMLSVLERQHVGYPLFGVPVGLLLLARWAGGRRPWHRPLRLLPAAVLAAVVLARRPVFLGRLLADNIAHPYQGAPDMSVLSTPPRARGALFRPNDARMVRATAEALRRGGLGPGDTWFDFVSAPGLYYLFDRDCPIRYYEVGFYETEAAQREVIAAVEANPRVRLALMDGYGPIDGVANATRAPLVAAFLRERFRPFYRDDGVEFWIRKDEGAEATSAGRKPSASTPP